MPFDSTRAPRQTARMGQPTQTAWRIGGQSVLAGDCLLEMRALASSSIDLIVTSPPYNIGVPLPLL